MIATTVASSDGARLEVRSWGPDGAPPILFCHATGFHGGVWRACAAELPDRQSVALDFRGFGASTEGTHPLDWNLFATDVLAVVDACGLHGTAAVGHSMGGAALLLAEARRPGTFSRLVLFEPIVFPPAEEARPLPSNDLAALTRRRRERFDSHDAAIENFGRKPPLGALRTDVLADYVAHGFVDDADGGVTLAAHRDWEAATYDTGQTHHGWEILPDVQTPTLVVRGGDGGRPAACVPEIVDRLPMSEQLAHPDVGHFGPLENPLWFAGVVRDWIDR